MKHQSIGKILRNIVLGIKPELLKLSDSESIIKPAPDKWSPKEIIGHLIDSASNNHQRFVRAQFKEDLIFEGYNQEEWVSLQSYAKRSWEELLELWVQYNLQLAHLMKHSSGEILCRPISKHNFHQIAFKQVAEHEACSLMYFMVDYVAHLEHHLSQILPNYEARLGEYENNFHISPI